MELAWPPLPPAASLGGEGPARTQAGGADCRCGEGGDNGAAGRGSKEVAGSGGQEATAQGPGPAGPAGQGATSRGAEGAIRRRVGDPVDSGAKGCSNPTPGVQGPARGCARGPAQGRQSTRQRAILEGPADCCAPASEPAAQASRASRAEACACFGARTNGCAPADGQHQASAEHP